MAETDRTSLLDLLVASYGELLRRLTRRLGSPVAAADVAQDTYLRLQRAETLPRVDNPRAYLFRVADNLAADHQRRDAARRRWTTAGELPEQPDERAGPEAALDARQRLEVLRQAIDELPPKCRAVFLMHKLEGLSHAAIAARLGISKSMVEKHVMKALAHCRDRLDAKIRPVR